MQLNEFMRYRNSIFGTVVSVEEGRSVGGFVPFFVPNIFLFAHGGGFGSTDSTNISGGATMRAS